MRLPQIFLSWHKRILRMFEKSTEGGDNATPSIQDIAGRLAEEQQRLRQLEATSMPKERTLLVLGSKCVVRERGLRLLGNGKYTLILY
ncbi:GL18577 [Drosophila persimilis]|uniref:GL18577 n=1 Tax=Drosophila persimilis TaxID=7234 RepID=B4G6M0_DROPE|nr:GL18577 [Drosophila persimilis]